MSIFNNKNDSSLAESEGRRTRKNGSGDDSKFYICETGGDIVGVFNLWQKKEGLAMERFMMKILKFFGYRSKNIDIQNAIKTSCETRVDANERMNKVKISLRVTLNDEDFWFSGGSHKK